MRPQCRDSASDMAAEGMADDHRRHGVEGLQRGRNGVDEALQPTCVPERRRACVPGQVEGDDTMAIHDQRSDLDPVGRCAAEPVEEDDRRSRAADVSLQSDGRSRARCSPHPATVSWNHQPWLREAGPLTPAIDKERRDEPDRARCAGGLF